MLSSLTRFSVQLLIQSIKYSLLDREITRTLALKHDQGPTTAVSNCSKAEVTNCLHTIKIHWLVNHLNSRFQKQDAMYLHNTSIVVIEVG